tara:strand:- start:224 stop:1570 length:1347 start_codon:yes stop_codon:yes gene_type:complete
VAEKKLKSGGEFDIIQADLLLSTGKVVGLRSSIMGLTIFETIDQFNITGSMSIQDAFNLASFGPIIGQEYLKLKIATPNFTGSGNTIDYSLSPLMITSVDDRVDIGNGVQATTMTFCSRELVINQRARVRRNLVGSYSDIVEEMLKTDLSNKKSPTYAGKTMNIEPSAEKKKIIAPNCKPFDMITMATKYAVSKKFNQSTYFFWETTSGYNFKSLGDMYSNRPVMEYQYGVAGTRTVDGVRDIMAELSAIENYRIISHDTIWNNAAGVFSSELIVHNIISKNYKVHTYNYNHDFYDEQHLGTRPLAELDPDGNVVSSFPSKQYLKPAVGDRNDESFQDEFSQYVYNTDRFDLMPSRNSQLAMLESGLQLNIDVVGTTVVKAGDIVEIKIPSVAAVKTTKNETEDMMYNGNFLIRTIRHDFNMIDDKHTMSMNVTKDAFDDLLDGDDVF